ncbi:MAG: hypothetical protein IPN94_18965 [Sphingobacteriales bacterium]|nr:hypothetical protein [Sphingobacteriales bacterium]
MNRHDDKFPICSVADIGLDGFGRTTARTGNSRFKKLAVQWLNQVQFFNQTFVVADSLVLRNPTERQALFAPHI